MRHLAQKLEEEGVDSELRRYCERILRVRSTGWTQGIFANFAAESMIPKGREWGGGNWEIKTPTNLKDIPQWALAAEVMPYMKTDDGTIPSIVTDHIGVYLGLVKGRGNVVEVREDSLMKVIKDGGGIKVNGLQAAPATTTSDKPKASLDGESRAGSLMGLEMISQQFAGSGATDAQAKAEEEFKKSLYGSTADGSSSDEEGTSKTKKLHIRIRDKPVASPTVDVNKIKEATKQLRLPIGMTKSTTGSSPDLRALVPQVTPATTGTITSQTSLPADLFGTNVLVQGPHLPQLTSVGPSAGVTARPIPEDFFQNTISSLQVAASLAPAGTILSRLDQNPQGQGISSKVPANQSAPAVEIGLPDGGIPPQANQEPGQYQSIGIPNDGVPSQLSPQPVPPQPRVQMAQLPVSSQPLDLSSLETPGSQASGKPSRSASPPKAVRPGQVNFL